LFFIFWELFFADVILLSRQKIVCLLQDEACVFGFIDAGPCWSLKALQVYFENGSGDNK